MIPTTKLERRVCKHVARREGDLVELLRALVAFDTVTHSASAAPRQEAVLQRFLGDRLATRGAAVTVEEPDAALIASHPMVPPGFSFSGRPQLGARFAGAGGGRTLLLNGHVDVEPREAWSSDPFDAVVPHGVDEHVSVAALVACTQGIALAALRFCGGVA